MKKTSFILMLLFCAAFANAQNQIVPKITAKSIKVEMPEYADVSPFIKDGLIKIESSNKVAYVNLQGKYVYGFDLKMQPVDVNSKFSGLFSCAAAVTTQGSSYQRQPAILCQSAKWLQLDKEKYTQISDFTDGICAAVKKVKNSSGYGTIEYYVYLDVTGKEVLSTLQRKIENSYSVKLKVSPLREGLRAFYDATLNKWGYADAAGKVVIQPKYGVAIPFSEGLAAVCLQDGDYGAKKWGFIDKTGKEIVPCTYKMQPASFSDGLAVVNTGENSWSDAAVVFIDKTGKKVSPDYKLCNSFFGGFAYVETQNNKTVLIDKNFNIVKETDFPIQSLDNDRLRISEKNPFGLEFINGLAAAGYIEEIPGGTLYTNDGKVLFEQDGYNAIYNFYDGKLALCRYRIDGKGIYGFINKNGEFVIYFEQNSNFSFTTPQPQNAACDICKTDGGGGGDPLPEPVCPDVCNMECPDYDFCKCNPEECKPPICTDKCNPDCPNFNPEECEHICLDICDPKCPSYNPARCIIPPCDICEESCANYNPNAPECKKPRYSCNITKKVRPTYELRYSEDCSLIYLKILSLCPPDIDESDWYLIGGENYRFSMQIENNGGFGSLSARLLSTSIVKAGSCKIRFRSGLCTTEWFDIKIPECPESMVKEEIITKTNCNGETYKTINDTVSIPKFANCDNVKTYFSGYFLGNSKKNKEFKCGGSINPCETNYFVKKANTYSIYVVEKFVNEQGRVIGGRRYYITIPAKKAIDEKATINEYTYCYPTTGNYRWWKGRAYYNAELGEWKEEVHGNLYIMINTECNVENPYDKNSCGLIWFVPDGGLVTQEQLDALDTEGTDKMTLLKKGDRLNFALPYAIVRNNGGYIDFGVGGYEVYPMNDDLTNESSGGVNSRKVGMALDYIFILLKVLDNFEKDVQEIKKGVLINNGDGTILIKNGLEEYNSIDLQPFNPGMVAVQWFCPFGKEKDKKDAKDAGIEVVNDIRKIYYPKLKNSVGE
ncbi:MAG: WG repeat-containing protein [Prevotellaceae bacterium]|jgi:hypothetical protein|nr:WG repeat-containing protein [Prevotellaceae bacterium]